MNAVASDKLNLIGAEWQTGNGEITRELLNPADVTETVAAVREAGPNQVDAACAAAHKAFVDWSGTPSPDRVKVLFAYRALLEKHFDELAQLIVRENGKLFSEAKGDVRRGLDVVEFACGVPTYLKGEVLPDVATQVDTTMVREPLGVVVGIPPFNFPAMIPLWTMPLAVATGNTFILKPAEKAPLTATRLVELFREAGAPDGVVNVLQGGKDVSERLIADARVKAVTFVGSSAVAKSVYEQAAKHGKRVQALGGGKNHLLVMPDADLERSIPALVGSCYGCAGQRCLAGSVVVAIGDEAQQDRVVEAFVNGARGLKVGDGNDPSSEVGPLHSTAHKEKVLSWIERGIKEGATLALDGRDVKVPNRPNGAFVGPTVFDHVTPEMAIGQEEVFGPFVTMLRAKDLPEAINLANKSRYGNSASIFTQSGAAARTFRAGMQCGMLGLNLGVPAPMAYFSFGGWKESLFGDTHVYGPDAINFYTRKKVVTERWFGATVPHEGWV